MSVKKLIDALQDAASIFAAGGAKTQSKGIENFLSALRRHESEDASRYIGRVRTALTQPEKAARPPAGGEVVDYYLGQLNAVGTDESEFRALLARMNKDKRLRKPEMDAVAASYTGGRSQWKTKKDAAQAIVNAFNERAYEAVKMLRVDKGSRF